MDYAIAGPSRSNASYQPAMETARSATAAPVQAGPTFGPYQAPFLPERTVRPSWEYVAREYSPPPFDSVDPRWTMHHYVDTYVPGKWPPIRGIHERAPPVGSEQDVPAQAAPAQDDDPEGDDLGTEMGGTEEVDEDLAGNAPRDDVAVARARSHSAASTETLESAGSRGASREPTTAPPADDNKAPTTGFINNQSRIEQGRLPRGRPRKTPEQKRADALMTPQQKAQKKEESRKRREEKKAEKERKRGQLASSSTSPDHQA
ncbi:uncharacterized protein RHO25_011481 [Cercospora beticola]|uniref:Uncharacterized protein n=1 Tax=Cercospora beticola TaxID=122368 RepID=A0ABZ0P4T9_CERBT|nr:hypothetical protein RHO25_011481 [Cercospora beticola]